MRGRHMKETQLKELLCFMEEREEKLFQQEHPSSCGQILEDIPYKDDHDVAHTLDILYPLKKRKQYPFILYVHGGGFCMHSKDKMYRTYATRLAQDDFAVVNINYRLAPKAHYKDILYDVYQTMLFLSKHRTTYQLNQDQMILCADSAGAYLAMKAICLWKQDNDLNKKLKCCGVASLCGILDLEEFRNQAQFPLKKEIIHMLFCDDQIPPHASIFHEIDHTFPPVYLMDTEYRSFYTQANQCYQILKSHRIPCQLHIFPKEERLRHNFQMRSTYLQSQRVLDELFHFFHDVIKLQ